MLEYLLESPQRRNCASYIFTQNFRLHQAGTDFTYTKYAQTNSFFLNAYKTFNSDFLKQSGIRQRYTHIPDHLLDFRGELNSTVNRRYQMKYCRLTQEAMKITFPSSTNSLSLEFKSIVNIGHKAERGLGYTYFQYILIQANSGGGSMDCSG